MSDRLAEQRIAREAAEWYLLLHSGQATEADRQACERWRASHESHTRAWQLAEHFYAQLDQLPGKLALSVLRRTEPGSRRTFVRALTTLVLAAPAGLLAYQHLPWQQWVANQRTGAGQQQQVALSDGSSLLLNTRTSLDFKALPLQRHLLLHAGELRLETSADPRPFFLQTRHGLLQVASNSRFYLRHDEGRDRIAVETGELEIRPVAGTTAALVAGQQTHFNAYSVAPPESLQSTSSDWVRGILRADRQRLADFVVEVSRYRQGIIHCDPAVADLLISGTFRLSDTDRLLEAVAEVLPIQLSYRTRYWVGITHI